MNNDKNLTKAFIKVHELIENKTHHYICHALDSLCNDDDVISAETAKEGQKLILLHIAPNESVGGYLYNNLPSFAKMDNASQYIEETKYRLKWLDDRIKEFS